MSHLILKGPLQISLFPTRKSSSLIWDLVFADAPYPYKGLASSLRHGTNWAKSNIIAHLILERPLQISLFRTRKNSSLIWDLVFAEMPYLPKGLNSSLRHDTSWAKLNIMPHLKLEGPLQASLFSTKRMVLY
ncbi:Uncharacterized protein Adt_39510 [Abeliophyllum distichum]|uniref:Uncharacterized protein n=1 Tax=Abeliophyllum distichum TaxID=126358 RepID=A0ABD1Q676_9LAMI